MVISPPTNGVILVILGETDKFIPENLNNEKVVIFRRDPSTNNQLVMVKDLGKLADPSLLKKPEESICKHTTPGQPDFEGNPLHTHADGTWWFYEETWTFENGPFPTYEEAETALEAYCLVVLATREEQEESTTKDLTTELEDATVETDGNIELHTDTERTSDASGDGPDER